MKVEIGWDAIIIGMIAVLLDIYETAAGFVVGVLVHEWFHVMAVRLCGGQVTRMKLSACGGVITYRGIWSYGQEAMIALAGAAGNVTAAYFLAISANMSGWNGGYIMAGVNVALAIFNLLPICPLDGGNAVYALVCGMSTPQIADGVLRWLGGILCLGLLGFGVYIWVKTRYNISMLLCGGYVTWFYWRSLPPGSSRWKLRSNKYAKSATKVGKNFTAGAKTGAVRGR